MSIYYGPSCTCGAWMSVTPPAPCPIHQWSYTTTDSGWTRSKRNCIGRHCAHDSTCNTFQVQWVLNG